MVPGEGLGNRSDVGLDRTDFRVDGSLRDGFGESRGTCMETPERTKPEKGRSEGPTPVRSERRTRGDGTVEITDRT